MYRKIMLLTRLKQLLLHRVQKVYNIWIGFGPTFVRCTYQIPKMFISNDFSIASHIDIVLNLLIYVAYQRVLEYDLLISGTCIFPGGMPTVPLIFGHPDTQKIEDLDPQT